MSEKEPHQGTPEEISKAEENFRNINLPGHWEGDGRRIQSERRERLYNQLSKEQKERLKDSSLTFERGGGGWGRYGGVELVRGKVKGKVEEHDILLYKVYENDDWVDETGRENLGNQINGGGIVDGVSISGVEVEQLWGKYKPLAEMGGWPEPDDEKLKKALDDLLV